MDRDYAKVRDTDNAPTHMWVHRITRTCRVQSDLALTIPSGQGLLSSGLTGQMVRSRKVPTFICLWRASS